MGLVESKVWSLEAGAVHVWHARVSALPALEDVLSVGEKERAGRLLRPEGRTRYVAARGMLRCVLGGCLGVAPGAVAFAYNPHGKPGLADDFNNSGLQFNLAHSGDVVTLAVTKGCCVGIDVERIRSDFDLLELAESRFAADEAAELRALPAAELPSAFFRCWTRKEAYLKARSEGLDFGLNKFSVTIAAAQAPALRRVDNDPAEPGRWAMFDLEMGAGYAAALVVRRLTSGIEPSIAVVPYLHA